MRTAKEIRQYLKSKPWYKDFVYNVKKSPYEYKSKYTRTIRKADAKRVLKGYFGLETLEAAFSWHRTKEGPYTWALRDQLFEQWYEKGKPKYISKADRQI